MCIDYRQLNKYTKRIEFPVPNADMLLDMLSGAAVYSALDLALGYHQLRIKDSDVQKTSFKCQFGQFEFLVMPFGLTNAPSAFQRWMNHVLQPHKNTFILVYLDDVLIFSNSLDEHLRHLDTTLGLLANHDIRLRLPKCFFGKNELEYLGHMVSQAGLRPSDNKVAAVKHWAPPRNVQQVQQFLGFCNFYRRYIHKYSHMAAPLYDITRKTKKFEWGERQHTAFNALKHALCSAPVLMSPITGPTAEFIISTDASKFALGAVLLQKDKSGLLRPCAYYAKILQPAHTNYPTYDQELLGVVCALKEWRCYVEGAARITVITDHATLRHLPTQDALGRRHALWLSDLSPYLAISPITNSPILTILYRKGSQNEADALSRRPDLRHDIISAEKTTT